MNKLAVVALGGNALLRGDQVGTIDEQEQNTFDTLENLVYLIKEGYDIVIGHGNGPQVGNILMRNDAGEHMYNIPQMPLDICVADSQGGIGYMIERMLRNVLKKHNIQKEVVTLVTCVVVDKNDPAFADPQKRVGKIYTREEADKLIADKGWIFKEEVKAQGGFRRVVPSPKPISIMNESVVESLARQGNIVITVGGGGVPVYIDEENRIRPSEAVIDKDLASAVLAKEVKADRFYIITDVPKACLNYNKPNQVQLDHLTVAEAKKYAEAGEFAAGSMGPKILAAINFVENGGKEAIITCEEELTKENCGTRITMN
ncbi:MAG TPA: carbamate kinase [Ignavibacteriales bacterium]|nr:carbamate kinase [Ignavibacteriales bacterium]